MKIAVVWNFKFWNNQTMSIHNQICNRPVGFAGVKNKKDCLLCLKIELYVLVYDFGTPWAFLKPSQWVFSFKTKYIKITKKLIK